MKRDVSQLKCGWCSGEGKAIGYAYNKKHMPNQKIVKCTKCQHEWQATVEGELEDESGKDRG